MMLNHRNNRLDNLLDVKEAKSVSYVVHCFHGKIFVRWSNSVQAVSSVSFSLGGSDKTVRLTLSEDRCTLSSTGQKGANQIVTLVTTEKLKYSHTHKTDSDNLVL